MVKRRRLNRKLVIERAAELVDEAGDLTAVSLTALAKVLQIRTPSLYNHVANLEDLQYGLALYGVRELLAALRQAAQGLIKEEAILAVATAYRKFAHKHPGIYPLTVGASEPDEIELEGAELTSLSQELVQLFLLIMGSLGLQGDDAIHTIRGLRAILHGFVSLEAAGGYKMALDREKSFNHLLTTYLAGLRQ